MNNRRRLAFVVISVQLSFAPLAQAAAAGSPLKLPEPLGVPAPGPVTDQPYAPQPILPGGIVIPL